MAKTHIQRKNKVFEAYGGAKCNCCGETERYFLTIDHINNDGAEHRKTFKKGEKNIYTWLYKHNFPTGFQILCMNCNFGKYRNFYDNGKNCCPHKN